MDKTFEVILVNDTIWATEYLINGEEIKLTKCRATIDITSPIEITRFLTRLDEAIRQQVLLSAFSSEINLHNLFRLLTAFYYNESLECWKRFFDEQGGQEMFMSAFEKFFGFKYCVNYCDTDTRLFDDFHSYAKKSISLRNIKAADSIYANAEGIIVERTGIKSNVCTFLVNNNQIDICLSGRPQFRSAIVLLETIQELKRAIEEIRYEQVRSITNLLGNKAVIDLSVLFFSETMAFLIRAYAIEQTKRLRQPIYPSKILKAFFGTGEIVHHPYYLCLLSMLEELIPAVNRILINSNISELESENQTWTLYEEFLHGVRKCEIYFHGPPQFIRTVQMYCRKTSEEYIAQGKAYCRKIQKIALHASIAAKSFEDIGIHFTTFSDLVSFHMKALKTHLSSVKEYRQATQKMILLTINSIYKFEKELNGADPKQLLTPGIVPKIPLNPTPPLSSTEELPYLLKEAPEAIQLALGLFRATGARTDSICKLLSKDLYYENGKWVIKITLWKTMDTGKVPFVLHELEESFALRLKKYIIETEDLRNQLDKPYLLVYQSNNRRPGSIRKPLVVTSETIKHYFKKYFSVLDICDNNGLPISCTPRTLRATYGHELYLEGVSEDEAARRMGNSPAIKAKHYTNLCPSEMADELHAHYKQSIVPILQDAPTLPVQTQKTVMYGTCDSGKPCNPNNCAECSYLFICKTKPGQKRGDVNAQQLINST